MAAGRTEVNTFRWLGTGSGSSGLYGAVQTVRRVAGWDSRVGLSRRPGGISVAAIGQGGAVAMSNIAGKIKGNGAVVGVTAKPLEKVLKSLSDGYLAVNTSVEEKRGIIYQSGG